MNALEARERTTRARIEKAKRALSKEKYDGKPLNFLQKIELRFIYWLIRQETRQGNDHLYLFRKPSPRIKYHLTEDGYALESGEGVAILYW